MSGLPMRGDPTSPSDQASFDPRVAFSRNIGWVTGLEQQVLGERRVAIAGLGGVGGAHLATLARLGVRRFSLADPERFDQPNLNRQVGATIRTLGRPKAEVLSRLAEAINPTVELTSFSSGVDSSNLDAFLEGADLYLDGLDLFAMDVRRSVFARCRELGIPAVTACPLGMGSACMVFLPGGPSFERYFRLEGHDLEEQVLRFLVGLAPASLQRFYLAEPGALDLRRRRAPSTPMGVALATGMASTTALKLLLGRGRLLAAPWAVQIDAYSLRSRRTWRPGGNANPLQRFILFMARRSLRRAAGSTDRSE